MHTTLTTESTHSLRPASDLSVADRIRLGVIRVTGIALLASGVIVALGGATAGASPMLPPKPPVARHRRPDDRDDPAGDDPALHRSARHDPADRSGVDDPAGPRRSDHPAGDDPSDDGPAHGSSRDDPAGHREPDASPDDRAPDGPADDRPLGRSAPRSPPRCSEPT